MLKNRSLEVYVKWMAKMEWSFFMTGTTKYEMTLKSARRLVERWFEKLDIDGARLFWVAERFEIKDGHHVHGLLYVPSSCTLFEPVDREVYMKIINSWQVVTGNTKKDGQFSKDNWNRIELQKYDKGKGAAGYCAKYISKEMGDYDFIN